ncbi:MAG TPA: DUF3631 domain-containing protein, partial [Candidatus Angelobacter sp.]|nr:DUF3631 domain-containing protein [Candidatus Angelobacter sp.]
MKASAEAAWDFVDGTLNDAAEIKRLASLSRIEYDRQREAAAAAMRCRVGSLDKAVEEERAKNGSGAAPGQGRPIELPEREPWPHPVNGAALLDEITEATKRHMVMAPGAPEVTALWVLHTHAIDAVNISPRLGITSPCPGCGKTTLQDMLYQLTPRPLLATNITAAAVFRTVEIAKPTLLCDEADSWLGDNAELRGILNTGHRRGGSVIRLVGDDHDARQFATFCASTISMIGKLPATLTSRSVPIPLQRKLPGETIAVFDDAAAQAFLPLARKAARWAADNMEKLRGAKPQMPAEITNRDADNWRVLIAIADTAGGNWPTEARRIAVAMTGPDTSSENLLADIRAAFAESGR